MQIETSATIKLPNFSARVMRSALMDIGADWQSWIDEAELDQGAIDNPTRRITGAQELKLQKAFSRVTADVPGLWFQIGRQYRLIGYGPLGLAVLTSETFGVGLQVMSSFRALTFSMLDFPLIDRNERDITIVADDRHVPEACREFNQERGLGAALRILSDMHPGLSPVARVETVLTRRADREQWASELGIPVIFGAPVTRLICREGVSSAHLPMADTFIGQSYSSVCDQAIQDAETSNGAIGKLYRILRRATPNCPTAAEASLMLGVSQRTLHRRLAEHGLTFGDVLDQVRQQRAIHLLDNASLSVEQVAVALGFSEAASFSRAFKRWAGVSPLSFRRRYSNRQ